MQEMQQAAADLDIPQEAEDALDDLAIDATDPQGMLSLSLESVFRKLRQTAADEAARCSRWPFWQHYSAG